MSVKRNCARAARGACGGPGFPAAALAFGCTHSEDFASLGVAGLTLGKTVSANLHRPTYPPEPTTHEGQLVMGIFSWIGVSLVGGFVVPYLKTFWLSNLHPILERWKSSQCVLVVSLRVGAEHGADQSFAALCMSVPKAAAREPAIAARSERRFPPRAQFSKPSVIIPYTARFCSALMRGFQHYSLPSLPVHHDPVLLAMLGIWPR